MYLSSALGAIVASVVASLVAATSLSAQPRPSGSGLFGDNPAAAVTALEAAPDRTVVRSRSVTIDFAQLAALERPALDRPTLDQPNPAPAGLMLNLFPDASYTAVMDRIDPAPGGFVWVGHLPDIAMSTVTLTSRDGMAYGSILTPAASYVVRPATDGAYTILQIDQDRFPPESNPVSVVLPPAARFDAAADPGQPVADDGSQIDVMVLYTPAAAAAAGGTTAINALISTAISVTNTTYANSGVVQRVRLAYSAPVAYTESGDITADLSALANGAGAFGGVNGLRNTYAADLVSLLTARYSATTCGIGYLPPTVSPANAPFAFSVVEQGCAVSNLSLPHELGHNMGANHDWYVASGVAPFTYGHGYVNLTGRFRTVMAYPDLCAFLGFSCSRLPYWANPDLSSGGVPLGIAGGTDSSPACYHNTNNPPCDADDHRVLNNTALTVANYRQVPRVLSVVPAAGKPRQQLTLTLAGQATHFAPGTTVAFSGAGVTVNSVTANSLTSLTVTITIAPGAARGFRDVTITTGAEVAVVLNGFLVQAIAADLNRDGDFDGDAKADLVVFRPASGQWFIRYSSLDYGTGSANTFQWGLPGDVPLAGDFDGDGKTDLAVWRPSNGTWYIRESSSGYANVRVFQWGLPGDVPIAGDFDGDGEADLCVWRPSDGTWYIRYSSLGYSAAANTFQWGLPGDVPIAGDFDGDGKADLCVWRATNGSWYIRYSSQDYNAAGAGTFQWGLPGDVPLAADFDGDGMTDLAVFRPSIGGWFISDSSTDYASTSYFQWGLPGDVPMTTDFDADGKAELAVFRPSTGEWFVRYSSLGYTLAGAAISQWGLPGDLLIK